MIGVTLNIKFIREVGLFQWAYRTVIRQFYKRILKQDHKMRLPTGEWMALPISSRFATEAYMTRADVDWGSEKLLNALIDGHGVLLDVGANIGYYSLYFAPKFSAVYSFEPDPRVRLSLEQIVKNRSNIHVIPYAVSANQGLARFVLEQDGEVSHLSMEDNGGDQIEVELITIDAFACARNLRVEAIKIDVEGHDKEVIEGALTTLTQQKPIVLAESSPNTELFTLMSKVAYRVFAYVRHPVTRQKHFQELVPGELMPGETKMLFLTPEHMVERIKIMAKAC